MNYLEFRNGLFDKVCFSVHQIRSRFRNFNFNNLTRWVKKGLLVKLKNGYYAFSDYLSEPNSPFYIANRIYRPSYVSLHSALAFYGIIPEAVVQITCIASLKTADFNNRFGAFSYKSVLPDFMFGYDRKPYVKSLSFMIAGPEKSILDLLYLYPFYNTSNEIENLRFDEDVLNEIIDKEKLLNYACRFNVKTLSRRVNLMMEIYGL